jgi:hypothetical protein
MTKVRLFVLLAVVALVLFPAMAVAQPPLPCRFHGTVLLDGEDVAGNTTITATIGNDTYTTQTPSVYGASTYLLEIAPEEGTQYTAGETITFMIGARAADQTSAWETGGNIELNLTVGGPGPVSGEIDVIVSWSEGDSTLIGDVLTLYLGAQPQGPAGATGATGLAGEDGEDATGGTALPVVALVIAIIAAGVAMMSMRRRV